MITINGLEIPNGVYDAAVARHKVLRRLGIKEHKLLFALVPENECDCLELAFRACSSNGRAVDSNSIGCGFKSHHALQLDKSHRK